MPRSMSSSRRAFEAKLLRARSVPLGNVRLTAGALKPAREANGKYLLELQGDCILAYSRERAELPPKAEGYPGWDGGGRVSAVERRALSPVATRKSHARGTNGHIASVFGVRLARTKDLQP